MFKEISGAVGFPHGRGEVIVFGAGRRGDCIVVVCESRDAKGGEHSATATFAGEFELDDGLGRFVFANCPYWAGHQASAMTAQLRAGIRGAILRRDRAYMVGAYAARDTFAAHPYETRQPTHTTAAEGLIHAA